MTTSKSPTEQAGARSAKYDAAFAEEIELKWQRAWAERRTFEQANPGDPGFDDSKPKFYCLDMFPYPSGSGLHVGHPEGYTATDILCRYKRMRGCNVLHPMGWDAFGLPAEQYAVQTGVHPAKTTRAAIETFRRQLQRFGFCYDWSREFATIDRGYYRWTQWIFLKLYHAWYDPFENRARTIDELLGELGHGDLRIGPGDVLVHIGLSGGTEALGGPGGVVRRFHELSPREQRDFIDGRRLAYIGEQTVNWCPKLGTVLANEEVIDGRSERGGHPVLRKPLRQWMLRITAYAERLLRGLDDVEWPESTKIQQTEWIGRSEGAEIDFALDIDTDDPDTDDDLPPALRVFTTRPDTVFGATYMVVAPEHAIVRALLDNPRPETDARALEAYADAAASRTDVERQESKDKTGVFTGLYAINPFTDERIPVWTADYVLIGYGFGAIMAVPAHDQRDFEFAEAFGLPIVDVVYPRPVAAAAYFASNAAPDESPVWRDRLADLIGLAVRDDAAPTAFPRLLERVRAPRDDDGGAAPTPSGEAGAVGQARGAVREQWLEFVEGLGAESPAALRAIFESKAYWARSGDAFAGPGFGVNSGPIDGLPADAAKAAIIERLEAEGIGRRRVNYKLRDWLFSRQRYWGEPFPIVFDEDGDHHPIREDRLPVVLPELEDFKPAESDEPTPLLGKAEAWAGTTAGDAGAVGLDPAAPVTRELNTMPNWAGSCWYYLRFCDPANEDRFAGADAERYWLGERGVDLYIGGAEHAVLHLLYARFWHMVLYDLGHVTSPEPFRKLYHQGLITSYAYKDASGRTVPVDEVEERAGAYVLKEDGEPVEQITAKMSKTLKNVVNPDDVIAEFGADAFRLYEMYLGPLESSQPWRTTDIVGMFRFLQDVWRLAVDADAGGLKLADAPDAGVERQLHRTIAKVGGDIERLAFNTAIASMIEFKNAAQKGGGLTGDQLDRFVRTLCPFAPHLAEELWSRLGGEGLASDAAWPTYDEAMLRDDEVEIPVQIMGKVKARVTVPAGADAAAIEAAAMGDDRVRKLIEGKTVRKVVVVPGRMVNIVAN